MFMTTNEYISNNTTTSKMHWKKIANIKWNTIGHSATITSHVTSPKAYTLPQRALYVGNKAICVKYSCTERSKMWNFVNPVKTKEWCTAPPPKYLILNPTRPNKTTEPTDCSSNVKRKLIHTNKQINIEIPKTKTIRIPYLRRPHSRPHKLRLRVTPEKYHLVLQILLWNISAMP